MDISLWKGNNHKEVIVVATFNTFSSSRLVVQRTKRVDESQDLLLEMLEDLTSGTEEEKQSFMKSCVETLNQLNRKRVVEGKRGAGVVGVGGGGGSFVVVL